MDITLLPEHRSQGIGTQLLRELQNEAAAAGKSLSIHVETFNPALHLYERLGFKVIEDKGLHLLMAWQAADTLR
jgi:ribosomal protein S18 acetylase RimI-like enzyme